MGNLFIKLAFRNLVRNRIFALVNIFGLAFGMASSMLIIQYVVNESSYDKFHEHAGQIYRIRLDRYSQGELAEQMATACNAVGPAVKSVFPEVVEYAILSDYQLEGIVSRGDFNFRLTKSYFASAGFFNLFSYPLLTGDPAKALSEPFTVVISESLAKQCFGDEEPMGEVLMLNSKFPLKVTGVFKDLPDNTHLKLNMLISVETMYKLYGEIYRETWWADVMLTYVLLKPGTDDQAFVNKLNGYVQTRFADEIKQRNENMIFHLQPLTDIHLYSNYPGEAEINGNGTSVYFMLIIAILIIVIAWVNYINLSTARSMERARDVGMRKVAGATRIQLIRQFLIESLIINVFAGVAALIIVETLYPFFERMTGLSVDLKLWSEPEFWMIYVLILCAGSVISGVYPAFILSSMQPVVVLKSKNDKSQRGITLRKVLIMFQFVITIMLITGSITIKRQVDHMQRQDLGVDISNILVIKAPVIIDSTWPNRVSAFKQQLRSNPGISNICASYFVPGDEVWYTNNYIRKSNNEARNSRTLSVIHVDHDYLDLYGLKLLAGRNFDPTGKSDLRNHIINREAMELLGFRNPEDAIDEEIETPNWKMTMKIVGVIENFRQESPRKDYMPTIYTYLPHPFWTKQYSIKINPVNSGKVIDFIKHNYDEIFPGNTFEYFWLENHYLEQYKADMQFGKTFELFAYLTIIISVSGLFALTLFLTLQRNREVAIRKVLGAGTNRLLLLLSRDYFVLLGIAMVFAMPVVFIVMENWLDNFASRITIGWWFFILPLIIMSCVIMASIFYLINKTARLNAANTLKYE